MNLLKFLLAGIALLMVIPVPAQQRVDPRNRYERVLLVVPVVGAGTLDDPRRPMYTPGPKTEPDPENGILGYAAQFSDDGKFALVELVALDRKAFAVIVAERRADVKMFERGKATRVEIETEFRKFKRDFKLDQLEVRP